MYKTSIILAFIHILVLHASLISFLQVPDASAESLNDAWNTALAVDHRLQASRNMTEASQYELSAAKSSRLPSLNLEGTFTVLNNAPAVALDTPGQPPRELPISEDKSVSYSSVLSLPLFTSGRIVRNIDAASAALDSARHEEMKTSLEIKLNVSEAYIASLRAGRAIEIAESAVASLASHAGNVEHFFTEGVVPRNDLLAARVALSDARQQAIRAHNAQDISHASYNRMLHRPLDQKVDIEDIPAETTLPDIGEATSRALHTRPELAGLSAQIISLQMQAESVRASAGPQLALQGAYRYEENRYQIYEDVWSATVGLKWDIFDGGIARNNAGALIRKAESLRNVQSDTASIITLQVRQAWLDLRETLSRIEVTREATQQAEENLRVVKDRYREGVGTNTEVLDAETLRTKSYTNYYNAVYDAALANIRLRYAIGEL